MTKIIIAGDSWGTHSYEPGYDYPDLHGFKFARKKNYVLYPGPGYFLQEYTKETVTTIADHGISNSEALEKIANEDYKDDIIILYQTGILRDITRAYMKNSKYFTTNDCLSDYTHYADKFYASCKEIKCKHLALIGGCVKVDEQKANGIDIIEPSITEWLDDSFADTVYDNTHYWLESVKPSLYKNDDFFKRGVIESATKIDYWKSNDMYYKAHPTVKTNKKIAKRIYDYLRDRNIVS